MKKMMAPSSKLTTLLNTLVALVIAVNFFVPVYVLLTEFPDTNEDVLANVSDDPSKSEPMPAAAHSCLNPPSILPAEDGSRVNEENRLTHTLTHVQTTCDVLVLPGKPRQTLTTGREDLRGKSYVCVGGTAGLKKDDCLVYSFGVKHGWTKFPEVVERHLGCQVRVFDPAFDYIDHYHTKNIRFFNARLSDIDQEALYNVAGEKGWKYRKFLTLAKAIPFENEAIDHMRLDVTQDLWRGMSTMLKDGSLLAFVKQLSFEYDLNRKNAGQMRETFVITQWLNGQGFLLAHSQPTKLSGKSYSLTYINTKMGLPLYNDSKYE